MNFGILAAGGYKVGKFAAIEDRDDFSVFVLDEMICEDGNISILREYPILLKEYNMDGTKKDAMTLIRNMEKEKREMFYKSNVSSQNIMETYKNIENMYFELIFRQLEQTGDTKIQELARWYGNKNLAKLFSQMINYFETEKQRKKRSAERMILAQEKIRNKLWFKRYFKYMGEKYFEIENRLDYTYDRRIAYLIELNNKISDFGEQEEDRSK